MISVSDIKQMLNFVKNTTRMFIPGSKAYQIDHIDRYDRCYKIEMILSIPGQKRPAVNSRF
jgi:hypothetical protein